MAYTREQRAANAAKAAVAAAQSAQATAEPPSENNPNLEVPQQRPAYRNDDRTAALAEIEARHNQTSGNASQPEEEPAEEEAPVKRRPPARAHTPQPVEPTPPPAPPPAPPDEPSPEEEETITVKVDGESFQAPKSEVEDAGGVRAYQTMRAADNRLRKANETLAATRQTQAQLAAFAQQAMPRPAPAAQITADEALQAIRFGTADEGYSTLQKLIAQAAGKPVDPDAIMKSTMVEMEKIRAAKQFMTEFADIAANPILYKTAVQIDTERMQEAWKSGRLGPAFDFPEHYRKIGNEIRSAFGRQSQSASAPATTASQTSQPSDKESRKATIVNLPSSSARAELPAEPKPETREEILNSYRKARGQSTL